MCCWFWHVCTSLSPLSACSLTCLWLTSKWHHFLRIQFFWSAVYTFVKRCLNFTTCVIQKTVFITLGSIISALFSLVSSSLYKQNTWILSALQFCFVFFPCKYMMADVNCCCLPPMGRLIVATTLTVTSCVNPLKWSRLESTSLQLHPQLWKALLIKGEGINRQPVGHTCHSVCRKTCIWMLHACW